MQSIWFSNRGQAIQTLLTFVGVLLSGASAWPAISQFQFLSIAPIVFYVLIGLFLVTVAMYAHRSSKTASSPIHETPSPVPIHESLAPTKTPIAAPSVRPPAQDEPLKFKLTRDLQQFKLSNGEIWKSDDRRVVLHDVLKNTQRSRSALIPDSDYVADVEVTFGGRLIYCGPSVKELPNRHFLIPVTPSGHCAEPGALYAFSYSHFYVGFDFLTIEHINFHAKQIDGVFYTVTVMDSSSR